MAEGLVQAYDVARRCGVTRLSEITHLDGVGTPVFQAVRPWSRGLSVHQGKGLTPDAAAIGALMEAVESHFAEAFEGPVVRSTHSDLPPETYAPPLAYFGVDRTTPPSDDEPLDWVQARGVGNTAAFWLPYQVVSLDFTSRGDARLDRSSDGLACTFDVETAAVVAMREVLERDAVAGFLDLAPWRRAVHRIDAASLSFPWLEALRDRLCRAGVTMTFYHAPAVIGLPVIVCEVFEPQGEKLPRHRASGSACHPDAETALQKAALEALQSRLTAIAGARDDIVWDDYAGLRGWGLSPPLPPGVQPLAWSSLTEAWRSTPTTADEMAARLRQAGYPTAGLIELAPDDPDVAVVKAIVPGLGSERRSRRPPMFPPP